MRFPRSLLALPVALIAGLVGTGTATAAIPWATCSTPAGFQCARVTEQLDHSGAVGGSVNLDVVRKPASIGGGSKTAIIALAGGPGQAAIPFAKDFATIFGTAALSTNDLIVFNQRGTGNSSPISCAAFRRTSGSPDKIVQDCSLQLGQARAFYTTAQSVEDIEQLRIAGGYDNVILYGVSYGTKVALAYAAAHPATTKSIILDSVVTPDGPDALRRSTLNAVPRVIGQTLCGNNACASSGGDPVGDITKLVAKLNRAAIKGTYHSSSGKNYRTSVSINDLIDTLEAGDLNPALRSEFPGAAHAALQGDTAPLIRLAVESEDLQSDAVTSPDPSSLLRAPTGGTSVAATAAKASPTATASSAASEALAETTLYYATVCEEATFPWTRGAPTVQRAQEAETTVRSLPATTFGIFGSSNAVALGGLPTTCLGWVVGGAAPQPTAPLPNVPALILDGEADLRTPLEDAKGVASQLPQAQFITVPDTGHSVVTSESGTCAQTAVKTFLAGGVAAACPAVADEFAPSATPPRSLSQVPRAHGVATAKIGRTLNALVLSINDGRRQVIGSAMATGSLPTAIGGLRAGTLRVASSKKLQFIGYEFVPGVKVTGILKSGTSTFTMSGSKGSKGTVKLLSSGAATGRLDGHTFKVSPRASASRAGSTTATDDGLPSLDAAVAFGKRLIAP
ncbi:MAG: alpha/beta fold hydrolase [Solirubrobacteraceae bacterium]|nr:alpha/beta fold hydrolase [Patulibacter sp.]